MSDSPRRAVIVDVDSLRPDHVGAYGHSRATTPALDAIAAGGVQFTRAYAANTPCMPSRAAFLTSRYGVHNGVETHGRRGMDVNSPPWWPDDRKDDADHREWQTLAEALFHERVYTAAVSSFPRHPAPWFTRTWHEFHQPQEPAGDRETFATPRAEDVVDRAIEAIPDDREEFLLYVQFWEPHKPYNRDQMEVERFRGVVSDHPHPTEQEIEQHTEWDAPASASDRGVESRSDLDRMLAAYDAEIRHFDDNLRRLVTALETRDLYEDTLLIITADHGEEFGEHGVYQHHASVHEGTQRIPLVVKPPASQPGATGEVDALVTNADLADTVMDYFGVEQPGEWQGRSLRPLIEGQRDDHHDAVVLDHGLYTAQRAVRKDDWKLVKTLHSGAWDDHLPETALYNVADDPWERDDLADEKPDVVRELETWLDGWLRSHRDERLGDPLEEVAESGPAGHQFWQQWTSE